MLKSVLILFCFEEKEMVLIEYAIVPYEERIWKVYVHINKINGKKYFGITRTSLQRRWRNGYGYKPQEKDSQHHFWNAIQKYGWNNFYHIVIKRDLTRSEACTYETSLISYYKTQNQEYGYNFTPGGDLGFTGVKMSKECCLKKSGKNHFRSVPVICLNTKKIYESMNLAAKDVGLDHGQLISRCCHGKAHSTGTLNGEPLKWMFLEEYKKLSPNQIKEILDEPVLITNSRPVVCINNGKRFNSAQDAASWVGLVQASGLIRCCQRKRHCAGVIPGTKEKAVWRYADEYFSENEKEVI